jgi:hypothetical protein
MDVLFFFPKEVTREKEAVLFILLSPFMLDYVTTSIFVILMQNGRLPIMLAATCEKRELVEILLPQTKPIPSVPDWSVDGIIRAMKLIQLSEPRVC